MLKLRVPFVHRNVSPRPVLVAARDQPLFAGFHLARLARMVGNAAAAWLVWRRGGWAAQRGPLTLYLIQLALNAA
jgi:hypothetical protein